MNNEKAPLLEMKNIKNDFFGNQVLTDINLVLKEGEVLGLCGENGAGKSTLMKILFGDKDIHDLELGGLFHDIGKIGVPDTILRKETKLTDDEYSEIKNHPAIGEHILSSAVLFKDIIPIVKHHHERYDGNRLSW